MKNQTTSRKTNAPTLSLREQEVLSLIAYEHTSKQIAQELYISRETVISHRKNIMHKFNVTNVAGMVREGFVRGILTTILFLNFSVSAFSQFNNGFDLTIKTTGTSTPIEVPNGADLLTGSRFTLDAVIQVPMGCTSAKIEITVPGYVELDNAQQQTITPGDWLCMSGNNCKRPSSIPSNSSYQFMVESAPGTFNSSSGTTDALNIQYNFYLMMGSLCEGENFDFQLKVTYYDEMGSLCEESLSETTSFTSKYRDDYWQVFLTEETPDSNICLGEFRKYRIDIPARFQSGGYNSINGRIIFAAIGEVYRIYDEDYNQLTPNYLCIGSTCYDECWPVISIDHDFRVLNRSAKYYVVMQYDCNGCDYVTQYNSINGVPNGITGQVILPCESNYTDTNSDEEPFDPNLLAPSNSCCGSGTGTGRPPEFTKRNTSPDYQFCPGSCESTSYSIEYNTFQSSVDISSGLCITDNLPTHYDLTSLSFGLGIQNYFSSGGGNTAQLYFKNSTSTDGPYTIDGSNYNQNFLLSNTININYDQIEICYDNPIPAFSGALSIQYYGKFNSNNQIGDVISVNATSSIGDTSNTVTDRIRECEASLIGSLRAYKPGVSPTSSLKVDRGDKFTLRAQILNIGTQYLESGNFLLNIPPNFTYCLGTAKFAYSSGPTSTTTTLPHSDIGGTWVESPTSLSLTNFDLPNRCNNGNKSLYIEIDLLTNEDAIAGPNSLRYTINNDYTRSANVTVNSIYQVTAQASVYCQLPDCQDPLQDSIAAQAGDFIYYRYDIINEGNVPLENIEIINNIPDIASQKSDCSDTRVGTAPKLQYSDTPFSCTIGTYTEEYSDTFCGPSYSAIFDPNTKSIRWTTNTQALMPADTFSIVTKYQIPFNAPLGSYSVNDFSFTALRNDIGIRTETQLSNEVFLETGDTACILDTCDTALSFDGTDDFINRSGMSVSGDFTVSAWFWSDSIPNGGTEDRIIAFGPDNRLEIGVNNSGQFWLYDASKGNTVSYVNVRDNAWHHLALTRAGNNCTLYLDGISIDTYTTIAIPDHGPNFSIGRWTGGAAGTHFKGLVDNVSIWTFALPDNLVADLSQCNLDVNEPGLVAFYNFNQGNSESNNTNITEIIDVSQNSNDLSIFNMALTGQNSNFVCSDLQFTTDCNLCGSSISALCKSNLSFTLDPLTDQLIIDVTDIDDGSSSVCSPSVTLSFDPNIIVSSLVFDCPEDIGEKQITLYVNDSNGSQSSCTTTIDIISSNPDLAILEEFYTSTGGDDWINNTGWLTNCDPCGQQPGNDPWFGLTCTANNRIQTIYLLGNNLEGTLPASINQLTEMSWFNVNNNHLDGAFPDICNWTELVYFQVGNNNINLNNFTGPLPSCFNTFENLEEIYVQGNSFTGPLPELDSTTNPKLSAIRFSDNQFTGPIPPSYGTLTGLTAFEMHNNNLSGCYDYHLYGICNNPNLMPPASNATISDGNSFDADWDDFCSIGAGFCCVTNLIIDSDPIPSGHYFGQATITINTTIEAGTNIHLNAPVVNITNPTLINSGAIVTTTNVGCN